MKIALSHHPPEEPVPLPTGPRLHVLGFRLGAQPVNVKENAQLSTPSLNESGVIRTLCPQTVIDVSHFKVEGLESLNPRQGVEHRA